MRLLLVRPFKNLSDKYIKGNSMKQILVYSDSLSWGIIPNTRKRLAFNKRWTGIFENTLNAKEQNIRVIENCLNGRRTVWSDPYKDGRNGSHGLAQVMEINSPLSLVVLLLGHNDFQARMRIMHGCLLKAW